jgi:tRNA nucleotidyltransferase (CCA-adding enzyme)
MRAVRFAAVLEFELERETEAAIASALEVFDKVSRERVHVELFKLLRARRPSVGLEPMLRTGLWGRVLGEETVIGAEAFVPAADRLPPDAELRLARLLWPLRGERAGLERVLDSIKPSRATRKRVLALCSERVESLGEALGDAAALRRCAAGLGREHLDSVKALLEFDVDQAGELDAALDGAALNVKELELSAKELIAGGVLEPGPLMGDLMRDLLDQCIEEPALNESSRLLGLAREWVAARSSD